MTTRPDDETPANDVGQTPAPPAEDAETVAPPKDPLPDHGAGGDPLIEGP